MMATFSFNELRLNFYRVWKEFWAEVYSEPCQTSKMKCFAKIGNVYLKVINYYCKRFHLRGPSMRFCRGPPPNQVSLDFQG